MKSLMGLILVMLIFGCTSTTQDQAGDAMEEGVDSTSESMNETAEEMEETMEEHMDEMMDEGMMGEMHGVTVRELAGHNSAEDCWLLYKGQVYDMTAWLPNHPPGADKITPHCGKSTFEEAFTDQHGESKVGILQTEGVLIGNLIE